MCEACGPGPTAADEWAWGSSSTSARDPTPPRVWERRKARQARRVEICHEERLGCIHTSISVTMVHTCALGRRTNPSRRACPRTTSVNAANRVDRQGTTQQLFTVARARLRIDVGRKALATTRRLVSDDSDRGADSSGVLREFRSSSPTASVRILRK